MLISGILYVIILTDDLAVPSLLGTELCKDLGGHGC